MIGLVVCAASILYHTVLLHLLKKLVAACFKDIGAKEVCSAANWLVSILNAGLATLVGCFAVRAIDNDLLDTRLEFLKPYAWFSLGYWIYDMSCMFLIITTLDKQSEKKDEKGDGLVGKIVKFVRWWPGIVLHHVGMILFLVLGITGTNRVRGDGIVGLSLLMEFSSIFVAFRSFLGSIGQKDSRIYVTAGILMVVAFFLARIIFLPYIIHLYSVQVRLSFLQGVASLPLTCSVSTFAFYCLNVYWFSLMVKGCVKLAQRSGRLKAQ